MSAETLADIAREMRTYFQAKKRGNPEHMPLHQVLSDWADRIEAAAKRERGALVAEAEAAKDARNRVAVRLREEYAEKCRECKAKSGNAAAMREAIVIIRDMLINGGHDPQCRAKIVTICNTVLSTPPRNCDVGTPKEQAERFKAFCLPRVGKCSENSTCPAKHPCNEIGIQYCQLKWAQMPYEDGGAGC